MSGLANSLANLKKEADAKDVCGVARLLRRMDNEDRIALESVLASAASSRMIHKALRENGVVIDRTILNLHRKRLCACAKEAF